MTKKELENRLIEFSVGVTQFIERNANNQTVKHLRDQVIRSSTAVSLNYGEAQSAESKKDFIHKSNIVLKELRETQINLRMVKLLLAPSDDPILEYLLKENDELLAIFHTTVMTARKNC
jgi:four helix bundle protein